MNYAESVRFNPNVEFEFSGIEIRGTVMIRTWDDIEGFIEMKPERLEFSADEFAKLSHDEFYDLVKKNINDDGFGCKEIVAAHVNVIGIYIDNIGTEAKRYLDNEFIGIDHDITQDEIDKLNEYIECEF